MTDNSHCVLAYNNMVLRLTGFMKDIYPEELITTEDIVVDVIRVLANHLDCMQELDKLETQVLGLQDKLTERDLVLSFYADEEPYDNGKIFADRGDKARYIIKSKVSELEVKDEDIL